MAHESIRTSEDAPERLDHFKEDLLSPENPGENLLSVEEWLTVARLLQLSGRERSVAILVFEGKSRSQIARELSCSPETVRVYIDRLFEKLNVHDRVELVLRIVRVHFTKRMDTEQKFVTGIGDLRGETGQV